MSFNRHVRIIIVLAVGASCLGWLVAAAGCGSKQTSAPTSPGQVQTNATTAPKDVAKPDKPAATSPKTQEIYNVGAGNPQPVNRLVELIGGPVIHIPKRPGEPDCTWADISKISRELGWQPKISFPEGVATMLQNIDYWRNAPVWDPVSIEAATKGWFAALSHG